MKIDVRFRGIESSPSLRDHAERQVRFHLARYGRELGAVVLRLGDVNGPKGGLDKCCHVTARGPRVGSTTVEEYSGDAYAAVDHALERLARSVSRGLERTRESWKSSSSPMWRVS